TGGVDIADPAPLTRAIAGQAREAVAEADLVLFVVDARAGVTPGDEEVAQILREAHKPVLVLANKIDDPSQEPLALELHRLGLGERTFVLIDTAGLRRKRRHRQGVEYYSELRAIEAAERADVALVLIDSSEGIVEQDIAVADVSRHADCSTLVVLSKWDATTI